MHGVTKADGVVSVVRCESSEYLSQHGGGRRSHRRRGGRGARHEPPDGPSASAQGRARGTQAAVGKSVRLGSQSCWGRLLPCRSTGDWTVVADGPCSSPRLKKPRRPVPPARRGQPLRDRHTASRRSFRTDKLLLVRRRRATGSEALRPASAWARDRRRRRPRRAAAACLRDGTDPAGRAVVRRARPDGRLRRVLVGEGRVLSSWSPARSPSSSARTSRSRADAPTLVRSAGRRRRPSRRSRSSPGACSRRRSRGTGRPSCSGDTGRRFGVVDPIYGKDVGYFVFSLPFELMVSALLLWLVAVAAAVRGAGVPRDGGARLPTASRHVRGPGAPRVTRRHVPARRRVETSRSSSTCSSSASRRPRTASRSRAPDTSTSTSGSRDWRA